MKIKNIRIKNFKSIYGEQYFDFETLDGLIKLSGVIGAGKTTVGEAILWGLYGKLKDHKNPNLVSWHLKECEIEINLISRKKEINIIRNNRLPLEVKIDGKTMAASNKRDAQEILEEEYFDVPSLAVQKMCIISFNAFNNSLCSMSPGETRLFLDEIFGFKTFTEYNDEIVNERKIQLTENSQLQAVLNETRNQIRHLNDKKETQKQELSKTVDITGLDEQRKQLIDTGIKYKSELDNEIAQFNTDNDKLKAKKQEWFIKKMECMTLGKAEREYVKTFGEGKCPTCGHKIDESVINEHKEKLQKYLDDYAEYQKEEDAIIKEMSELKQISDNKQQDIKTKIEDIRKEIQSIDSKIKIYNNNIQLISENYDDIIKEYEDKIIDLEGQISESDKNIGEWNEMNELFSKTLRYGLLDTLIPHINKSIKYYMNKLEQEYTVEYDQEFKPHIYIENNDTEISYKDLSTGQKKTLDIAIIFGVIQNVIANVDFNIFFLDELLSNMDADSRYIMLTVLKDTLAENRTIFVVNHAEMPDDFFNHKIRVSLQTKKIVDAKKKEEVIVKTSKYEKIF